MKLKKYWHVWLKASTLSAQSNLSQRGGALMFILGKFIRFGFFLVLLVLIGERVDHISGYTLHQMIIFYLFFNLFDIIGQLFFRGIYQFRQQIISGEFDFRLVKPMSPLFQALTRYTDILDIPLLILILFYLVREAVKQPLINLSMFCILFVSGFIIITAIHIFVAALGILTTEVDHTIMIYRDLSSMARFPIDIYALPIRGLLTFIIPIAIAFTVPAKAFMGLIDIQLLIWSLVLATVFFFLSLRFWRFALTKYSSASS
ncbi:ABC transporter permease [Pseudomonadota bacterium]